jgi:hypothetical protein
LLSLLTTLMLSPLLRLSLLGLLPGLWARLKLDLGVWVPLLGVASGAPGGALLLVLVTDVLVGLKLLSLELLSLKLLSLHLLLLLGEKLLLLNLDLCLLLKLLDLLDGLGRGLNTRLATSADAIAAAEGLFDVSGGSLVIAIVIDVATSPAAFAVHSSISLSGGAKLQKFLGFHSELIFWALSSSDLGHWLVALRHTAELFGKREFLVVFDV